MLSKQSQEERQEAIKQLIGRCAVSDQKQLVDLLLEHYGIETNQAVVSRDLRKLGVVKRGLVYEMPDIDVTTEILRLALVGISHNESLIVIKTRAGLADFVGDCVDQFTDIDILGCLAGENVVFVTPKSIKTIRNTYQALCERFRVKPE